MKEGYIEELGYEEDVFTLSPTVTYTWKEQLKTKVKERELSLMQGVEYTPDFRIVWSEKAEGIFYHTKDTVCTNRPLFYVVGDDRTSYIEIKPNHDFNNMTRLVKDKIKWLYSTQGIYVQIIKPLNLFKKTFCPDRFFLTDSGDGDRVKVIKKKKKKPERIPLRELEEYKPLKEFIDGLRSD